MVVAVGRAVEEIFGVIAQFWGNAGDRLLIGERLLGTYSRRTETYHQNPCSHIILSNLQGYDCEAQFHSNIDLMGVRLLYYGFSLRTNQP